jgi:hypothetical protein
LFTRKKIYHCRFENTWRWCFEPWYIKGKHQTKQHLWVSSGVLIDIDGAAAWVLEKNCSSQNSNCTTWLTRLLGNKQIHDI